LVESEMTILSLIASAGIVVKFVMAILMLASLMSWIVIFQRSIYLRKCKKASFSFENEFWSGIDLRQLYSDGSERIKGLPIGLESIFRSGFKEFNRLSKKDSSDREGIMDGVQRAMRIAISREHDELDKHLPFLASVASVTWAGVGTAGNIIDRCSRYCRGTNCYRDRLVCGNSGRVGI